MPKTKILYIITKSNWGGAQKNLFELANSLSKDAFEVSAIVGGRGELFDKLSRENIPVYPIEEFGRDVRIGKDARCFLKIFRIIKSIGPDVVHLHSPKASGLGAMASRMLGVKKIIYTVHGGSWNEDRNIVQKLLIKFFSWLTMLFCSKVILLSQTEYRQIDHWPLIKKKLSITPPGINKIDFLPKIEARMALAKRAQIKISQEELLIGSIGELHGNKGYTFALEAVASLQDPFKYFIAGSGEKKETLERIIQEKNLKEKIFLLGSVSDASRLLKAFDVFLLPSIKEGMPYVILEAGLAGLPIVSTNIGGIPEVIENGKDGILVNPKNSEEINNAILNMVKNPIKAREMGMVLQKKVIERYSLENMFMHTLDTYRI